MRKPSCPIIIDIEASGFGAYSYPIEIGAVKANGDRYCALIKPEPDWEHWCERAQRVHGIARELLMTRGKSPAQVCHELNGFLQDETTYSDAWTHDSPWLNKLFYAARVYPFFHLSPIELIATEEQLMLWDATKKRLAQQLNIQRHRASGDAFLIQQTYVETRRQMTKISQGNQNLPTAAQQQSKL